MDPLVSLLVEASDTQLDAFRAALRQAEAERQIRREYLARRQREAWQIELDARSRPPTKWEIRKAKRAARAVEIMRLARRGWTNKEIAARIGGHPDAIGRIVRRELRAAQADARRD